MASTLAWKQVYDILKRSDRAWSSGHKALAYPTLWKFGVHPALSWLGAWAITSSQTDPNQDVHFTQWDVPARLEGSSLTGMPVEFGTSATADGKLSAKALRFSGAPAAGPLPPPPRLVAAALPVAAEGWSPIQLQTILLATAGLGLPDGAGLTGMATLVHVIVRVRVGWQIYLTAVGDASVGRRCSFNRCYSFPQHSNTADTASPSLP